MANSIAPFGLRWARRFDGASPNLARRQYPILSSYATQIFKQSLVKLSAAGQIQLAGAGDDASTGLLGVLDGVEYFDTVQKRKVYTKAWLAPGTALAGSVIAHVIVDPQAVYEIQSNGVAVVAANVGFNAKITAEVGNTTSGFSTQALDASNISVTAAAYQLRIEGISQRGGTDPTLANNIAEVRLLNTLVNNTTGF